MGRDVNATDTNTHTRATLFSLERLPYLPGFALGSSCMRGPLQVLELYLSSDTDVLLDFPKLKDLVQHRAHLRAVEVCTAAVTCLSSPLQTPFLSLPTQLTRSSVRLQPERGEAEAELVFFPQSPHVQHVRTDEEKYR